MTSHMVADIPRPGDEGSDEALKVLLKMKELDTWLSAESLSALTGIPLQTLAIVLIGLYDRDRIEMDTARRHWKLAKQLPIKAENRRKATPRDTSTGQQDGSEFFA